MYARVTGVQGDPAKADEGIQTFNNVVLPALTPLEGYKAAFLLVDRETGKGYGISFWETEEARAAADAAVAEARSKTIEAMGGSVPPVELLEVASFDMK